MPNETPIRKIAIPTWLQILASILIVGLIGLHTAYPDLPIDGITVSLLGLLLFVWLLPYVESFKMPGGTEVKLRDMVEKAEESRDKVKIPLKKKEGALTEKEKIYSEGKQLRIELVDQYPHLALAGMRIEIEKRLRQLARFHKVVFVPNIESGQLLRALMHIGVLDPKLGPMLSEVIAIGNVAVHADQLDMTTANRALELGEFAISALDNIIEEYAATKGNMNPWQ